MGVQSAMYSGVSGLNTNSQSMSVIGNNLANANTIGFKGSRSVFSDLLASSVAGSGGSSQVGRGVGLSSVDFDFSQGTFETTASGTDVAIEGSGFFVIKEQGDDTSYYTRSGAFRFDNQGFLINAEGLRVQGKKYDPVINTELLPSDPIDIQVDNVGLIAGTATTELTFTTNLNESSNVIAAGAAGVDPTDQTTFNYSASSQIFDSLGVSHLISVYWCLTNDTTNSWEAAYTIDNDPLSITSVPATTPPLAFNNIGQLPDINADGKPDPATVAITLPAWSNGAATSTIDLTFNCTQFNSQSIVIGQDQNGSTAGELTNVGIDETGTIVANYSNGRKVNISQLVLAKFQNTGGLELAGSSRFVATKDVGAIRIGLPGPELGKIFTNSLEQSNVDMSQEFVKMITIQRGFQANSKIITTVDEMLGDLINLKR